MRAFAGVVLALFVSAEGLAAQAPPPPPPSPVRDIGQQKSGKGQLSGRVSSSETGRPLRRAQVRATSSELREGRSVSTDAEGRWSIKGLPAGRYSISVSKGGYVTLSYGQRRPFEQGKPVELPDGQAVDKLDVSLPRGGVITGRVHDEFGEPFTNVRVAAMRYRYMSGQRRLFPYGSGDTTDDIGQYRLHGLTPGEYIISASASALSFDQSEDKMGYAPSYFPGTAIVSAAQRVTVIEGQETQNVSFDLAPVRVATISGMATNSRGKPLSNTILMLMNTAGPLGVSLSSPAMVRPDGTFTLSNVPPGEYRLQAQSMADLEAVAQTGSIAALNPAEAVSLPLTVTGQDITGLAVVTQPTGSAAGKVVFDGANAPASMAGVMLASMPADPVTLTLGGSVRVREDGTFEARGMTGRRLLRGMAPGGWTLDAVLVGETDVTDTGVEFKDGEHISGMEVRFARTAPSITGTVQASSGKPTTDYVAVVFSADSAQWGYGSRRVQASRPDQTGRFVLNNLPPGDYLLAALEYLEPGEEGDPELLEKLRAGATRVTVATGAAKTVTLKMTTAR